MIDQMKIAAHVILIIAALLSILMLAISFWLTGMAFGQDSTNSTTSIEWDENNELSIIYQKSAEEIAAEEKAQTCAKAWIDIFLQPNKADSLRVWALIVELGRRGEICKAFGHKWRDGRPGEGGAFSFSDYHPNTVFRTCTICGRCESADTRMQWK